MTALPKNFLLFLGTSGARFSMMYQLRASGGMWLRINEKNLVIDPGPGSLVKICDMLPELDPTKIDAIILTHCHMDHSNDLNVLAESMTFGGRADRGTVILPRDCLEGSGKILLDHVRKHIQRIEVWEDKGIISLEDDLRIRGHKLKHHGVECFGFTMENGNIPKTGFISDTDLQEEWMNSFTDCRLLVANVTLLREISRIDHLSIEEMPFLIDKLQPEIMILDHMGTSILEAGPDELARSLNKERTMVIAARDGMVFDLDRFTITSKGKNEDAKTAERRKNMVFPVHRRYQHKGGR